jgi:hypothetical protein
MSTEAKLALKGEAIEEWIDLRFFRPVGIRIARALQPSTVTPNQVTMWSLWIGLLASHLFLYTNVWVNVGAFVLVVIADLLDSADGQLARLRGTASRAGRIMDGYADNLRWIMLYFMIAGRLMFFEGWGWQAIAFPIVAGVCHSLHSATIDFVHGSYLELSYEKGKVDLPENLEAPGNTWWWRNASWFYGGFVLRQSQLFPRTVELLRRSRTTGLDPEVRAEYARRQRKLLTACPWIGQNAHILALGAAGIGGMPAAYLWCTSVGMTAIAAILIVLQERTAKKLAVDGASGTSGTSTAR